MITIGDLNEYVTIQKSTITTDAMGGKREAFSDFVSTYAKVEWKEGGTDENNNKITSDMHIEVTFRNIGSNLQQVSARQTFRLILPAETGATTEMKNYWNINAVKLHGDQYRRYKTLFCSCNSADGIQLL